MCLLYDIITDVTQPPLPASYDLNLTRVNEEDGESTLIARRVSTSSVSVSKGQLPIFIRTLMQNRN